MSTLALFDERQQPGVRSSNLITISRLRAFRSCPRYHQLRYGLGYQPHYSSDSARFGTLYHTGLEAWSVAMQGGGILDPHEQAIMAARTSWSSCDRRDDYDLQKAIALLTGYDSRWCGEPLEYLAVEAEFQMPLINPDTGASSRTYLAAGKIDAIVRDANGRVWIMEHKTSSEDITPGSAYWHRLQLDGQISMYLDGARSLGYDVQGCIYDVSARPGQVPLKATPPDKRRYTKKTGQLDKRQREADETPEQYRTRILEAIAVAPEKYYQRGVVVRLDDERREAGWDVWHTARMIRETELSGRHVRNPEACVRYGSTCAFFPVCTGQASISDETRYRVTDIHPELSMEVHQ